MKSVASNMGEDTKVPANLERSEDVESFTRILTRAEELRSGEEGMPKQRSLAPDDARYQMLAGLGIIVTELRQLGDQISELENTVRTLSFRAG